MKTKIIAASSALLMVAVAQVAMANGGKIDFEGGVTATTCDVSVNNKGPNATVTLPTVSNKLLLNAGDTAGRTAIAFRLTNCQVASDPETARVFFNASNLVNVDGRLNVDTAVPGSASKVDLQILDTDQTPIDLTQDAEGQSKTKTPILGAAGAGTASILHYVRYYATETTDSGTPGSGVVPGKVTSNIEYEINYE